MEHWLCTAKVNAVPVHLCIAFDLESILTIVQISTNTEESSQRTNLFHL